MTQTDIQNPSDIVKISDPAAFLDHWQNLALAIDFEAAPQGPLFHVGAVFREKTFDQGKITSPEKALEALAAFAPEARFILGHNIVNHDLALVRQRYPGAGILNLAPVDTLFLSPLAFSENPYHKLVKNYKLVTSSRNDPVADARLAFTLFRDQVEAFVRLQETAPGLIEFFAFAFDQAGPGFSGICQLFSGLARQKPDQERAGQLFLGLCQGKTCPKAAQTVWETHTQTQSPEKMMALAYVLSWLRVAGGNSVLPPWVRHEFPGLTQVIHSLRFSCGETDCEWCQAHSNPEALLKEYFGFDAFRVLPGDGRPLQREIVTSALAGQNHLAILPTGGGKSICYQIPALYRFRRTGALTVIISPLKALMKDQVDNLNQATGTLTAAAINGSLTLPERGAVMERVRLGDTAILYISPEQLRNAGIAKLIQARQTDCWIFDEAHCLSKWGHDFRPDYLHVADLIAAQREKTGNLPLVGAFTATAKLDVVEEIRSHFKEKLGIELTPLTGGVDRDNLSFHVLPVSASEKYDVVARTLLDHAGSPAIVYCGTQKGTEALSLFLNDRGILSQPFHAGRSEPDKRNIQDAFIAGDIPVICATNAFGMGIDKKDIRLVIHADIPGSLENYLQEAGRAGRDLSPATCILLYEEADIDSQFSLNAYTKLTLKDINKILGALKKRGAKTPEIVITPGEIMRLIGDENFAKDDSRARIGVAWLERKGFLTRSFNQTLFFKGIPLVKDLEEADNKIAALNLPGIRAQVFRTLLAYLFIADKNTLISADSLCESLCAIENLPEIYLDPRQIMTVLSDMARAGLIREGAFMTAFVRPKGKDSSPRLLATFAPMEAAMADLMAELSPESSPEKPDLINLRLVSQRLKDKGFTGACPELCSTLLRTMASDRGDGGGKSLTIAGRKGADIQQVYVHVPWQVLKERLTLRHHCASVCLETLIQGLDPPLRSGQAMVLATFFISDIIQAMQRDVFLSGFRGKAQELVEASLLFLHDTQAITLQNGLGVFRQALSLTMDPDAVGRTYTKGDFEPLALHYEQKNVQVHVMEKYAQLGLEKIKNALAFVRDYFKISHDRFLARYFAGQEKIITTAMTAKAFQDIIQSLGHPVQEAIVAAPQETNLLVLAGPGSGKTRTIVHRCAWLIKAKSVNPESILVLCYNHQTMIELRKKIRALAGKAAGPVTACTFHGLAMRIAGRAILEPEKQGETITEQGFDRFIDEATEILEGKKPLPGVDGAREYLLARYRYILVDEYQDIDARQYRFISALTGRLTAEEEAKIVIMAVGDDDQSIYGFREANVRYIRKFKEDYQARTFFLTQNYRSSHPVIEAANSLISLNRDRIKTHKPCRINTKRKHLAKPPGKTDPQTVVALVRCPDLPSQARFVADRISGLIEAGVPARDMAVVSRLGLGYPPLVSLRLALAQKEIPFSYSLKTSPGFPLFRVREIQEFLDFLETREKESLPPSRLFEAVAARCSQNPGPWTDLIRKLMTDWEDMTATDAPVSVARARDFALSCLIEEKQAHKMGTGVFTGTVHSVKGMEFSQVFILDQGWGTQDLEEERRLFYVGMTRAKAGLTLCHIENSGNPHIKALAGHPYTAGRQAPEALLNGYQEGLTIGILGMEDLYISYAARFAQNHPVHIHLAKLATGDRVRLVKERSYLYIMDSGGNRIAALSQKGIQRWEKHLDRMVAAKVLGLVLRKEGDSEPGPGNTPRVGTWSLPILEILYYR